jgi:hypothetical protein
VRVVAAVGWFLFVFVSALLWFFPVDAVVRGQVLDLERRTGVRVAWAGERWSAWSSTLRNVTVTDASGHAWLELSSLGLRPRVTGIYVQGQAPWGGIYGVVRNGSSELHVAGYPVPRPPNLQFEDGRLEANAIFEQAKFKAHGSFNLSGRINIGIYAGPIDLSGTFELSGTQGQAQLEVVGDKLRGRGTLDVDATGTTWSHARIKGPVRIEQNGVAQSLNVAGEASNLTIQR